MLDIRCNKGITPRLDRVLQHAAAASAADCDLEHRSGAVHIPYTFAMQSGLDFSQKIGKRTGLAGVTDPPDMLRLEGLGIQKA